jgi:hypothetical protein
LLDQIVEHRKRIGARSDEQSGKFLFEVCIPLIPRWLNRLSCRAAPLGLRWQAKRDTAFAGGAVFDRREVAPQSGVSPFPRQPPQSMTRLVLSRPSDFCERWFGLRDVTGCY